jgi:pyridoxine 5-phosphate synthase
MVIANKPHQCTLVPDLPDALTSDNGWDTLRNKVLLDEVISELQAHGIRVSLFIDPDEKMLDGAKALGTDRIEFYTGPYAHDYPLNRERAIAPFAKAAQYCNKIDLGVNAGHDLNLQNLNFFKQNIPNLLEVSIGHALVCDSIYYGLKNTIQMYQNELKKD